MTDEAEPGAAPILTAAVEPLATPPVAAGPVRRSGRRRVRRAVGRLRLSRGRVQFSLFLLIVLTISRAHLHFHVLSRLRPLLLLTAVALLFAFLNPRQLNPSGLLRTWPARLLAALVAVCCLSAPAGISLGNSGLFLLQTFLKTILLTYLLIAACRNVADLYTFTWGYVTASAIISFFALVVFKPQKTAADFDYARLANLYTWDANDIVLVLLIGMALCLLVLQVVRDARRRLICLGILLCIGATVSRSGSRGGMVGFLAFGGALLLFTSGISVVRKVFVLTVALAGMVLFAPPGYWKQMKTLGNPTADYNYTSIDGRRNVARRGVGYMLSHPVLGIGVANFQRAECTISDKALNTPPGYGIRCTPPHNSFVEAGAETGFIGLFLWSAFLVGGVVSLRRWGRRLPRRFRHGTEEQRFLYYACQYLPVAIVGFGATSFFLSFAWMEPYYILVALTSGTIHCAQVERHRMLVRARRVRAERRARFAALPPTPVIPLPAAVE